ncbi:MAG: hypothetical protein IJ795_03185 [Bacteroidales bacterium]|nr:hypothetical protein [Bacteroidales bacterium]
MSDYSKIRNLSQLDKAIREVSGKISSKKVRISRDVDSVHKMLEPRNMFATGLRMISPADKPLDSALLRVVRRLKKWLS